MIKTSVILPTYNEVENIVPLVKEIEKVLTKPYEIIVVDDDSPDGTSQSVQDYIDETNSKHVQIVTRKKNHGLRQSIQHGIEVSKGSVVLWMDCDFSMPPTHIPKLISEINNGYDIAVGSRFVPGGKQKEKTEKESKLAIVLSTLMNKTLQLVFQVEFYDFTSGFIAIKREVIDELLPLKGDYGEYFIDLIVRAFRSRYSVKELPYINVSRVAGISKTMPNVTILGKRIIQYTSAVLRLLVTR